MDYAKMGTEALERRIQELDERVQALKADARAAHAALDRKTAEKSAAERVAGMGETERAALLQALTAEGIASGEAVGTPGRGGE